MRSLQASASCIAIAAIAPAEAPAQWLNQSSGIRDRLRARAPQTWLRGRPLRSAVIVRLDGMVIAKLGRQVTPSPARARRARANCRGWRRNRHFAKAQPQGTVLHATSVDDPMPARLGAAELRERGSALLRKSESMPRRESGLAACHSRRYGRYGRSQRHGFSPSTFGGGGAWRIRFYSAGCHPVRHRRCAVHSYVPITDRTGNVPETRHWKGSAKRRHESFQLAPPHVSSGRGGRIGMGVQ